METVQRGSRLLVFNTVKEGPSQREAFRKALHYGLDRDRLISMYAAEVEPAFGFVPEQSPRFPNPYNPKLAKTYLEESGCAGMTIRLGIYAGSETDAQWFTESCRELGLKVEVIELLGNITSSDNRLSTDLFISEQGVEDDLAVSMLELFLSENGCFRMFLHPDMMEKAGSIIRRMRRETAKEAQEACALELTEWIRSRHAAIFLFHRHQRTSYHPSLKGLQLNAIGWFDFREVWFETGKSAGEDNEERQDAVYWGGEAG
ncbi:ABC transporter substrate-binding protein [Paenibacillus sp. CC-CFT747]|nr:ABC transporter substrate-binding protein [Paenibacillus sp. CC-CFT747]